MLMLVFQVRTHGLSIGGSRSSPVEESMSLNSLHFASLGDAADFGDMSFAVAENGTTSNVRGIAGGGSPEK